MNKRERAVKNTAKNNRSLSRGDPKRCVQPWPGLTQPRSRGAGESGICSKVYWDLRSAWSESYNSFGLILIRKWAFGSRFSFLPILGCPSFLKQTQVHRNGSSLGFCWVKTSWYSVTLILCPNFRVLCTSETDGFATKRKPGLKAFLVARLLYAIFREESNHKDREFCHDKLLISSVLQQGLLNDAGRPLLNLDLAFSRKLFKHQGFVYTSIRQPTFCLNGALFEYRSAIILGDISNRLDKSGHQVERSFPQSRNAVLRYKTRKIKTCFSQSELLSHNRVENYDYHWGLGTLTHGTMMTIAVRVHIDFWNSCGKPTGLSTVWTRTDSKSNGTGQLFISLHKLFANTTYLHILPIHRYIDSMYDIFCTKRNRYLTYLKTDEKGKYKKTIHPIVHHIPSQQWLVKITTTIATPSKQTTLHKSLSPKS